MRQIDRDMAKRASENLRRAIRLTKEMADLADKGDADRLDDSCGILYGLFRDVAYRLRRTAEEERERHIKAGTWDKNS